MTGASPEERVRDCVVIGAGFGGLGAALTLAEAGARVTLCEALNYPGGCASTFTRAGHSFESGATLSSGFAEGQLFARWIAQHQLAVRTVPLDPIVELRTPRLRLPISGEREALLAQLCARAHAPVAGLRAFFALQKRVADLLWGLLDAPAMLPPFTAGALARHALSTLPRLGPLLRLAGRPLLRVLEEQGVAQFAPLRLFVDAVCQITVQASAAEAEAPLALAALDYFFRGTRHVHGGLGALAFAIAHAVEQRGGEVRLADAVRSIAPLDRAGGGSARSGAAFCVTTRSGALLARTVIANLLPHDLRALHRGPLTRPRLAALEQELDGGWSAAMLYRALPAERFSSPAAAHLELIADPQRPLLEGNHLFCSLSAADEKEGRFGARSLTVSTHLPLPRLRALEADALAAYIAEVQQRMRETLAALAPELGPAQLELTGSPRTFARFTRRHAGAVGGVPRRAGLHHYAAIAPLEAARGLFLAGDSVFPGQSTLAAATGGQRAASAVLQLLGKGAGRFR